MNKEDEMLFDISALGTHEAGSRQRRYHSAEIPVGVREIDERFEQKRPDEDYDAFYSRGGWQYDERIEGAFLLHRLIRPLCIPEGSRLLDLGCGTGFHALLWARMGMSVTAIDRCLVVRAEHNNSNSVVFGSIDAMYFLSRPSALFDIVFVRGMSWFHYELEPGKNRQGVDVHGVMRLILEKLIKNGLFILQIRTDFTGTFEADGIRNHTLPQATTFLQSFGEILLLQDWTGRDLSKGEAKAEIDGNGLLAVIKVFN